MTRAEANIEVIRLVKRLMAENRYATAEEQLVLSKYSGWGGIPNAFDPPKPGMAEINAALKELLTPKNLGRRTKAP